MHTKNIAIAATLAQLATAQRFASITGIQGFNSGASKMDNSAKVQSDFEDEMNAAQKLHNSPGLFNSVRLYTNMQWKTENTPIEAFDAALATNTSLLLGIWCSEVETIENELKALMTAVEEKGQPFADLVVGISVGSEDLYRTSKKGIENEAGVGTDPDTIVGFIKDTRDAIKDTLLADKPVGHVDTWSAWSNSSNSAVLNAVDFVGADMYVYYEDDKGNSPDNTTNVFDYIYGVAEAAARNASVPLWITETGHPTKGPKWGDAVASLGNAEMYWKDVGCDMFGRTNVWWYQLEDSDPSLDESFAIADEDGLTKFDLTCPADKGAPASINTEEPESAAVSRRRGGSALAGVVASIALALVM